MANTTVISVAAYGCSEIYAFAQWATRQIDREALDSLPIKLGTLEGTVAAVAAAVDSLATNNISSNSNSGSININSNTK